MYVIKKFFSACHDQPMYLFLVTSLKDIQRVTKYAHRVYYLVVLHSIVSVTPPLEFKLFLDSATSRIQKLNLLIIVSLLLTLGSDLGNKINT